MTKRATIFISLVPESKNVGNKQIEKDIKETLECGWLARIEKVTIE